ncbi:MAG: murein biosynthesis integral membrane protein MurJ [Gammaproteobacteria bacterium]|nr:MAG: murein biosynthesis integral membrane protein MurJ [Gammaproteobacteria bacterium]
MLSGRASRRAGTRAPRGGGAPGWGRSLLTVGGWTLASRVLGFLRDVVLAGAFGAGAGADAFFVVFKIPNFLRRLFAEGAFAQAFVPVLAAWKEEGERRGEGRERVRELVAHASGALGAVLLLLTLLAVAGAPWLVALFAPGFLGDPQRFPLAAEMLRLTFPYLPLISLTALAGAVLNTYGRFAAPAAAPVLLNLCLIGAALLLAPRLATPVEALAWGVLAAGLAQLLLQLPGLARLGLLARPRLRWAHPGVQRILQLMLPAVLGSSVAQLNLLLDTVLASFLAVGSVSWLYYSDRLVEFPLGVFGIALATVLLPGLSRHQARGEEQAYRAALDWALRWVLVVAVPATLGLAALAGPVLATLFQHGAFGPADVAMAARSLVAYALGLGGFILVKVLAAAFHARQDTRTPVRIALRALAANAALNLLLILPLAHAGLALATSLASLLNAALLYRALRRQGLYRPLPGWGALLARVALAGAAMAALLLAGTGPWEAWSSLAPLERAWRLGLWIGAGALSYALVLLLAGLRPRHLARGLPAEGAARDAGP